MVWVGNFAQAEAIFVLESNSTCESIHGDSFGTQISSTGDVTDLI